MFIFGYLHVWTDHSLDKEYLLGMNKFSFRYGPYYRSNHHSGMATMRTKTIKTAAYLDYDLLFSFIRFFFLNPLSSRLLNSGDYLANAKI